MNNDPKNNPPALTAPGFTTKNNETLREHHHKGMALLEAGFASGKMGILPLKLKATGEEVAVICLLEKEVDGRPGVQALIPIAVFINGSAEKVLDVSGLDIESVITGKLKVDKTGDLPVIEKLTLDPPTITDIDTGEEGLSITE